jgi:hypothetical protein
VADPVEGLEDVQALLEETDKMQGLGDAVSRVTHALGIHECGKCEERRRRLNAAVPFRRKKKKKA